MSGHVFYFKTKAESVFAPPIPRAGCKNTSCDRFELEVVRLRLLGDLRDLIHLTRHRSSISALVFSKIIILSSYCLDL